MTANEIRHALPIGTDRTVTLTTGASVRITVIEHTTGTVYAGSHPHLLAIPHEWIMGVSR